MNTEEDTKPPQNEDIKVVQTDNSTVVADTTPVGSQQVKRRIAIGVGKNEVQDRKLKLAVANHEEHKL